MIAPSPDVPLTPPPPLMPDCRMVQVDLHEAAEALRRAQRAWHRDALLDALASAERFIKLAQEKLG